MSFDIIGFVQNYNIDHVAEGHKHCRPGWVQVRCPFCTGNPGWHLGFELEKNWWNCWRCGSHRTWDVVLALLDGNVREAKKALAVYKGRPTARLKKHKKDTRILEMPQGGIQPMTWRARAYLEKRRFDPDLLEVMWHVQSTDNLSMYKHRLFIPFYYNNRMVTWQTRDITDTSTKKYLAQSEAKEIICNKDMLYGIDQATGSSCVVVEGVPDVWRLGPGAVGLQGIKYRPSQVYQLLHNFDEFYILFDPEPQALIQARKLANDLAALGGKAHLVDVDATTDPGDYSQDDADALMRDLLGNGGY